MKFAPLFEKIATAANEAQLRSTFLENAGELVGAKAWGFDLLDCRFQVIESDLYGLPDTFRDRYRAWYGCSLNRQWSVDWGNLFYARGKIEVICQS